MKKAVIGVAGVAVIVLVGIFVPLVEAEFQHTETYLEDEPYEATETYYETQPLAYEVVESYTDKGSYQERRRIVIGGIVFQDEIVEVFYPIGYVTLHNLDDVEDVFEVQFTFYAVEKSTAAIAAGAVVDFKYEDYMAAVDPDHYLATRDWDSMDWDKAMIFCDEYGGKESISLLPGETGTVAYAVDAIDVAQMAWRWEHTVGEPTKEVERERTVTKYRQVEKERLVTHYERVPLFEYLRSRQ